MGYAEFLADLFAEGQVSVPADSPTDQELEAGNDVLREHEQVHRLNMPESAPEFGLGAAAWAARHFYAACQCAVDRDIGEETLHARLGDNYESPITAEVHYSVDLVFRYLPDVARFASSAAEQDPLLEHLKRWARQWPLSSVGMPNVDPVDLSGFRNHAGLMQLYADRVIAKVDKSRLKDEGVRQLVQQAIGLYPNLAQSLHDELLRNDT